MAKLLLIDGTNIAYRWIKDPPKMLDNFPKTVISLAKSFKCEHILVSFDNKGSSFRKEILPDYKGHRNKNLTEEERMHRKLFYEHVAQVPELLAKHDVPATSLERVETDDIIAYICKHYHDKLDEIVIVSSDKDLYQLLIWPNIRIFSLTKKEWMDQKTFTSTYGIAPESWVDAKSLMGDSGDNIPGIPLVGEVRAVSYIKQYGPTYEDILKNLPASKKKFGKIDTAVMNSNELIMLNRKLIDLLTHCDDILSEEYKEIISMVLEQDGLHE